MSGSGVGGWFAASWVVLGMGVYLVHAVGGESLEGSRCGCLYEGCPGELGFDLAVEVYFFRLYVLIQL